MLSRASLTRCSRRYSSSFGMQPKVNNTTRQNLSTHGRGTTAINRLFRTTNTNTTNLVKCKSHYYCKQYQSHRHSNFSSLAQHLNGFGSSFYNNNDDKEENGISSNTNPYQVSSSLGQSQQVRWKRKDGYKAFHQQRPTSKKKLKTYHRRKRRLYEKQVGKHSKPGSKAGPRREFAEQRFKDLVNYDPNSPFYDQHPQELDYDISDALLDDLIGNTASYTSLPTPTPVYLGHDQVTFKKLVQGQMEKYHAYQEEQLKLLEQQQKTNGEVLPSTTIKEESLPDDKIVALALRSYRDKYGTKHKPIGLVKALQYLLKELNVPSQKPCWGEHTFTTLLTCCRTPKEARRVFKLMLEDHRHPISAYGWSILVDIHAKLGDFEGCHSVLHEMKAVGGISHIPLAAYTSFFAACYKVCNTGQIPHSVRAKAGNLAWESWKELNIENMEKPDSMAYGAMLRLCGARGQPERAINLLEEMQQFEVKPTTLCFTSALKAVSKSHQTSLRYERGTSKVNKRREMITAHHGKLARTIVILAENAEVEQDAGFVSALMLCAAAAGDSATAKAILLASDVRNMTHLRTIGSTEHLQRLAGENVVEQTTVDSFLEEGSSHNQDPWEVLDDYANSPANGQQQQQQQQQQLATESSTKIDSTLNGNDMLTNDFSSLPNSQRSPRNMIKRTNKSEKQMYEEREYGRKDTRTLSALLLACSQAAESKGLGDMWVGRDNKGYLCDNSLRLLPMRRKPKYMDYSIPGVSNVDLQRSALTWDEDEEPEQMGKRLRRAKFMGVDIDEDAGFDMETIPEDMKSMFTHNPILEEDDDNELSHDDGTNGASPMQLIGKDGDDDDDTIPMYGDDIEAMTYNEETGEFEDYVPEKNTLSAIVEEKDTQLLVRDGSETTKQEEPEEEWFFDDDIMRWKTRPKNSAAAETKNDDGNLEEEKEESEDGDDNVDWYFNDAEMRWETRPKQAAMDAHPSANSYKQSADDEEREFALFYEGLKEELRQDGDIDVKHIDEGLAREVFNAEKAKNPKLIEEAFADGYGDGDEDIEINEQEFRLFYEGLKNEVGDEEHVDEMDARIMFKMMLKGELEDGDINNIGRSDVIDSGFEQKFGGSDSDFEAQLDDQLKYAQESLETGEERESFEDFFSSIKDEWRSDGFNLDLDDIEKLDSLNSGKSRMEHISPEMNEVNVAPELSRATSQTQQNATAATRTMFADEMVHPETETLAAAFSGLSVSEEAQRVNTDVEQNQSTNAIAEADYTEHSLEEHLADDGQKWEPLNRTEAELAEALPGLPPSRIRKIRRVFDKTLGTPSMLRLVPLLRENMPEVVNDRWLKRKNTQDSHFVMKKAKDDGLIDVHMLNGLMQLQASCGSFNRVLQIHEEQFKKYNLKPTPYSDRIAIQMLVKHSRISRALVLKEKIESDGRNIDILSYGSMVEYYSRRGHLGSSLMLLRECIDLHGAPPPEKYLTKTRLLCRQQEVEDKVGIVALIGEDPVEWIRHGETNLKREYSKKGHLHMNYIRNKMRTGN